MSRLAILAFLAFFTSGCPEKPEPPACIEGASFDCACTDGTKGAQICSDKGTLGPCSCDSAAPAATAPAKAPPAEAEPAPTADPAPAEPAPAE